MSSSLLQLVQQPVNNLFQQLGTSSAKTCLLTTCEQTCNNFFADLLQVVRFYVCRQDLVCYTRKNAQLVTNLQQTCSTLDGTSLLQDLFALLVPSLLTSCYKPAADLLQAWWTQQPCYKLFQQLVIGLQVNNLSTSCEQQTWCNLTR